MNISLLLQEQTSWGKGEQGPFLLLFIPSPGQSRPTGDHSRWCGVTAFAPADVGWPRAQRGRAGTRGPCSVWSLLWSLVVPLYPGSRSQVGMGQVETGSDRRYRS